MTSADLVAGIRDEWFALAARHPARRRPVLPEAILVEAPDADAVWLLGNHRAVVNTLMQAARRRTDLITTDRLHLAVRGAGDTIRVSLDAESTRPGVGGAHGTWLPTEADGVLLRPAARAYACLEARGGVPGGDLAVPAAGGIVGRTAETADIVADHSTVSRMHARLRRDGDGRWWLEAMSHSNATTCDGLVIGVGAEIELAAGAIVEFGPHMRYRWCPPGI